MNLLGYELIWWEKKEVLFHFHPPPHRYIMSIEYSCLTDYADSLLVACKHHKVINYLYTTVFGQPRYEQANNG